MKNIFVQNTYNKFINNLYYVNIPEIKFYFDVVNNNIYKIYYNMNISYFIFSTSSLNDEIITFIKDSSINKKIIIYHDIYNEYLIGLMPECNHIIDKDNYNSSGTIFDKNIVNTNLYYNNPNILKKDKIVVFLEKQTSIPESVKNILYPNTTKVLMFNNYNIKNDQNFGFLSESDRASILQESEYFACDNDYYGLEAKLCGCRVLDINNLDNDITDNYNTSNLLTYNEYLASILS